MVSTAILLILLAEKKPTLRDKGIVWVNVWMSIIKFRKILSISTEVMHVAGFVTKRFPQHNVVDSW